MIGDTKYVIKLLCDFTGIYEKLLALQNKMDAISKLSIKMINENMHKAQLHEEYTNKYEELLKRYEKANVEYTNLQDEKLHKMSLSQKPESFIKDLEERPMSINCFDDTTFPFIVESVKINRDKELTFEFINGKEMEV